MDPSLEESATMSGANTSRSRAGWTLKLAWPAILATLLVLFVRAVESFPKYRRSSAAGRHPRVHIGDLPGGAPLPSQIGLARRTGDAPGDHLDRRVFRGRGSPAAAGKYATMTGKGFRPRQDRPRPLALGRGHGLHRVISLLIVALPSGVLLWSSFQKFYAIPFGQALQGPHSRSVPLHLRYPNSGGTFGTRCCSPSAARR